jgi:hypothetical protein
MNLFPTPTTQIAAIQAARNHLSSREYVFLLMALIALYCVFHEGARNILFSECYKLRFMRNTGSPSIDQDGCDCVCLLECRLCDLFLSFFLELELLRSAVHRRIH